VCVVDKPQDRGGLGKVREQAQRRGEDQEPVATDTLNLAEGRAQRLRLRLGQLRHTPHRRQQEPLQGSEGQRGLRLHTLGTEHLHSLGAGGQVSQEG
jgi:hypothetical protein